MSGVGDNFGLGGGGRQPQVSAGRRKQQNGPLPCGSGPFYVDQRSTVPAMKSSTASRASSSVYCTGGDFMK